MGIGRQVQRKVILSISLGDVFFFIHNTYIKIRRKMKFKRKIRFHSIDQKYTIDNSRSSKWFLFFSPLVIIILKYIERDQSKHQEKMCSFDLIHRSFPFIVPVKFSHKITINQECGSGVFTFILFIYTLEGNNREMWSNTQMQFSFKEIQEPMIRNEHTPTRKLTIKTHDG